MNIHFQKLAMFIHQFEENIKSVLKFVTFTGVLVQNVLQNDKKEWILSWEFRVCKKKIQLILLSIDNDKNQR